jgi:hypothetical protein
MVRHWEGMTPATRHFHPYMFAISSTSSLAKHGWHRKLLNDWSYNVRNSQLARVTTPAQDEDSVTHVARWLKSMYRQLKPSTSIVPVREVPPTTRPWEWQPLQLVLPSDVVSAMWQRAEQWDVFDGGRFEARGYSILVWSGPDADRTTPRGTAAVLLGFVSVAWGTPSSDTATLSAMAWSPQAGGSPDVLWKALSVLAGQPLAGISASV